MPNTYNMKVYIIKLLILQIFYIVDVNIFSKYFNQTLQSLTVTIPRTQTNCKQREGGREYHSNTSGRHYSEVGQRFTYVWERCQCSIICSRQPEKKERRNRSKKTWTVHCAWCSRSSGPNPCPLHTTWPSTSKENR
jgi:hypothetical protein